MILVVISSVYKELMASIDRLFPEELGYDVNQDIEFSIHQLVEVAAPALSPGINDPFTAITCIDRLGSVLGRVCSKKFPSDRRCDDQDNIRLMTKPFTFAGITNAAFDQFRQYGQSNAAVTIRLLEIIKIIARLARNRQQRQALFRQAQMIERVSRESLPDENDKKDMKVRYQALLDIINEQTL